MLQKGPGSVWLKLSSSARPLELLNTSLVKWLQVLILMEFKYLNGLFREFPLFTLAIIVLFRKDGDCRGAKLSP